jgi:hypothetical protein
LIFLVPLVIFTRRLLDEIKKPRTKLIAGIALGMFYYVFVTPMFWPAPRVVTRLPTGASLDEDLPIEVVVSAWHANVEVRQVRFYVDSARSTAAHGPHGPLQPLILYRESGPRRHVWSFWQVNRLTWPRWTRLQVVLPLPELAAQGLTRPGVLRGKVDVELDYVPDTVEPLALWLGYSPLWAMHASPFELRILPPGVVPPQG